ncbi:MAG: type II 3-dehydroquinate dehydratase [Rhodospirillales bacterium]
MTRTVLLLNGPNLNLLGTRQPELYGRDTLAAIEAECVRRGEALGLVVECRQSNAEGELVGWIQGARGRCAAVVINAGAYTHTSVAILDALLALEVPIYEVHLSNIFRREPFRHHSYVSRAAHGIVCGFGGFGYQMAIEAAARAIDAADGEPGNRDRT